MTPDKLFQSQPNRRPRVFMLFLAGLLALGVAQAQSEHQPPSLPYGDLPIFFEPNLGQAAHQADFLSHIDGSVALFDHRGVSLRFGPESGQSSPFTSIQLHLLHANAGAKASADGLQQGRSNYFIGNDRSRWRTNIPNYGLIEFAGIYPGIDVVYYGNHRQLEHDFRVAPGANPRDIEFAVEGVFNLQLDKRGNLRLRASKRELLLKSPLAYQERGGHREIINVRYEVRGNKVRFRLGRYDTHRQLIIDPVLSYSTYVSGSNGSLGEVIAVDTTGAAYIAGFTNVTDFPTVNPYQAAPKGNGDIFITKVNASGSALIYSTYLGGSLYDQPSGIAVDSQGNAIVVGRTESDDFPTLPATPGSGGNHTHGFITSLSPAGNALNWSQYTGGTDDNWVSGVALDTNDSVYVTGATDSPDFPVTPGTIAHTAAPSYPNNDIFVQKLSAAGVIQYSAVVGHLQLQNGQPDVSLVPSGIAVDNLGDAVVAGSGTSGLPTTSGAFQPNPTNAAPGSGSTYNGFILKVDAAATQLLFSTYFSGNQGAPISAVALDSQANVYVTGTSTSTDLFRQSPTASTNQPFAAKLDATGSDLLYATYIQGAQTNAGVPGYSNAAGITVDSSGDAYVVGSTSSSTFPLVNPVISFLGTGPSGPAAAAFITEVNPTGTAFLFSSFLSGSTGANGSGITLDQTGNAYVVGTSFSMDYPTTSGSYQTSIPNPPPNTEPNAPFLTKLNLTVPAPSMCFSQPPPFGFGTVKIGTSASITNVVTNCGNAALVVSNVTATAPFAQSNTCTGSVAPGASCSVTISFTPAQVASYTGALTLNTNAAVSIQTLQFTGSGDYSHLTVPTSVTFDNQVVGQGSSTTYLFLQVTGDFPVTISSVSTTGDFSADNGCIGTIYQTCPIKLTFTPTASGLRTGTLFINDDAQGGPHTVNLSGTAYGTYPVPLTSNVSKSAIMAGSPDTTIWVYGDLFFLASTVNWNGSPLATQFVNQHELSATLPASDLTDWKESQLSVSNPTPGGGTSNNQRVVVYAALSLDANQVIFEPFTQQLYVSVNSSNPTYGDQVLQIDPATASIKRSFSLGTNPTYLALSDDGRYLYVAIDGNIHVAQYDLLQQKTVRTFGIGNDLYGPYQVMDLKVAPGAPNTIAVSQRASSGGPNAGVGVLDSGVKRPDYLSYTDSTSAESISFVKDASTLYGSSYSFSPPAADTVMSLDSAGVHISERLSPPPFSGVIFSDGKYIYSSQDTVYDPSTNTVVGTYNTGSSYPLAIMLPDSDTNRTFGATVDNVLWAMEQSTFGPADSLPFADYWVGLNSQVQNQFVKWASDGYAFIGRSTSSAPYDFVLFRSSFGSASSATNTAVINGFNPPSAVAGSNSNLALTITGQSFTPGAVTTWNGQERTTHFISTTQLLVDIPQSDLAEAAQVNVTVKNPGVPASTGASFQVDGPPTGYLDSAASANNGKTVPQNDVVVVKGWAADNGRPVASVQVSIDGTPVGNATLASNGTAWTFSYPCGTLSIGTHWASAAAFDANGLSTALSWSVGDAGTFAITASVPPTGYLDSSVNAVDGSKTISQYGTLLVQGWAAVNGSPVARVQVNLDGNAIGNAALASSGLNWNLSYNIVALSPGSHWVSATAYDAKGNNTSLSWSSSNAGTFTVVKSAPTGYLDSASNAINGTRTVPQTGLLVVQGWAGEDGNHVSSVQVLLDGNPIGIASLSSSSLNWAFSYDIGTLSVGTHWVAATAYDAAGNSAGLNWSSPGAGTFTVVASNSAPSGFLDSVVNTKDGTKTVPQNGAILIQGWAGENGSPVARVQLAVDGIVIGNAVLSTLSLNWSFSYNIGNLGSGNHWVGATAFDAQGNGVALSWSSSGAGGFTVQ